MCVIFFQFNQSSKENPYQIVLAANRDEYFNRPARAAQPLEQNPNVICGWYSYYRIYNLAFILLQNRVC